MTAVALLLRLAELGVSVQADHDRLRLRPGSAVPPDLLSGLREHKAMVLVLLATAAMLKARNDDVRRAALQRPPSWSDTTACPAPGCFCSCCNGRRWWCELDAPRGWRCWTCHPPFHLTAGEVSDVRTTITPAGARPVLAAQEEMARNHDFSRVLRGGRS